ncbi:MAG: SPOR domain-containing protein [Methylococcales bacterium]|nr:SPOR domain-containing protein [Methylococcales bacterium]
MARDYKHRDYKHRANNHHKTKSQQSTVPWWKWVLAILLFGLFAIFLTFLSSSSSEIKQTQKNKEFSISQKEKQEKKLQEEQNEPIFDFYTILPETEIIISDHEIDTRSREEKFSKGKTIKYLIQAGSFRGFAEADKLRARLAFMGIESEIEKAIIGNIIWNRVVMGPYTSSSDVSAIRKKLRKKNIDSRVTEIKG